jgi:hypothetical protein
VRWSERVFFFEEDDRQRVVEVGEVVAAFGVLT